MTSTQEISMSAVSAISSGNDGGSYTSGSSLADTISSLASSTGADSSKISNLVDNLKAGIESGDSAKVDQSIKGLLDLLGGSGDSKASGSGSSGGSEGSSSGSNGTSKSETFDQLEELLESMGLSKDQISKIMNQARDATAAGSDTSAEGSGSGDSVGGVRAA
jgi:hypothetical protein